MRACESRGPPWQQRQQQQQNRRPPLVNQPPTPVAIIHILYTAQSRTCPIAGCAHSHGTVNFMERERERESSRWHHSHISSSLVLLTAWLRPSPPPRNVRAASPCGPAAQQRHGCLSLSPLARRRNNAVPARAAKEINHSFLSIRSFVFLLISDATCMYSFSPSSSAFSLFHHPNACVDASPMPTVSSLVRPRKKKHDFWSA